MIPMLELLREDGKELDIPSGAVVMIEEMHEDTNPAFPKGRAFLHYGMGAELRTAIVSTKIDDIAFDLQVTSNPQWLRLTLGDNKRKFYVLAKNIVGRAAMENGCEIALMLGDKVVAFHVNESRREIKRWTEQAAGKPPEGLIEMPTPAQFTQGD